MGEPERRERMQRLREKVAARPVELWASSFLETLRAEPEAHGPIELGNDRARLEAQADELAQQPKLVFLLDFDGTLVPLRRTPGAVVTDAEASRLLTALAGLRGVRVAVVSGRTKDSLEVLLGTLPIALVAEHGVWTRDWGKSEWKTSVDATKHAWRGRVREILDDYSARTPGSAVEPKSIGLAWHYRNVEIALGATRARELRLNLVQIWRSSRPRSSAGARWWKCGRKKPTRARPPRTS